MLYREGRGSGTFVHHSDRRKLLQVSSDGGRISSCCIEHNWVLVLFQTLLITTMVSEDLLIDINSGSRIEHDWVSVLFQILLSTTMVSEDLLIDITIVHYRGNICRLGDQQNSGTRKMVHFRDILQARGYSQCHFSQAHEDLVPGSLPGSPSPQGVSRAEPSRLVLQHPGLSVRAAPSH